MKVEFLKTTEEDIKETLRVTWLVVVWIMLVMVLRLYVFVPITVDGASMNPTLDDKDDLLLSKYDISADEIDRFDIVVFDRDDDSRYIKRVIGLPGDHIEYREDILYVNGNPVVEKFLKEDKKEYAKKGQELTEGFRLEEVGGNGETVPKNEFFVLGDNRQNSNDSRMIGTIPVEDIVGKAKVVISPLTSMRLLTDK